MRRNVYASYSILPHRGLSSKNEIKRGQLWDRWHILLKGKACQKKLDEQGVKHYKNISNKQVWKLFDLCDTFTLLRIMRLKWLQSVILHPQEHAHLTSAMFGDFSFFSHVFGNVLYELVSIQPVFPTIPAFCVWRTLACEEEKKTKKTLKCFRKATTFNSNLFKNLRF